MNGPPASSPPRDRAGGLSEAFFLILGLAVAFFGCLQPVWDPDSYWHLAVGREILRTGRLMFQETFSFVVPNSPWVDTNWLPHLLYPRMWDLGGEKALEWSVGVAAALSLLVAYLGARALRVSALSVSFCLAVWFTAFRGRFRLRPEAISLILFAALVAILMHLWESRTPRRSLLWLIPPLFLLWVQVHGSWSYGAALLASFLIGRILDSSSRAERWSWVREGLPACLAAAGCTLLTPYGTQLATFPFSTLSDFANPDLVRINEWQASPWNLTTLPFLLAVIALGASYLPRLWRREKAWTGTLWTLSQTVLVLLWVRYSSYAWLALMPVGGVYVERLCGVRKPWGRIALSAVVALASLARIADGIAYDPTSTRQDSNYPVQEARYLLSREISGNLFHPFVAGGFLEFTCYPRCRTFFDGRYYPFAGNLVDYNRSSSSVEGLRAFLERHPFEVAVVPYSTATARAAFGPIRPALLILFSKDRWAPVHLGPYGVVFLRRIPRYAQTISRDEFKAYFPGDEPNLIADIRGGRLDSEALLPEVDRAIRTGLPLFGPTRPLAFRRALSEGAFPRDIPPLDPGEK